MEAILFDWDGTLVDSLGAFHAANATVMRAFGLPFDVVRYRRSYVPDWREMYRRLGIPGDRLEEANALWETAFAADGDSVLAFAGAETALDRLRDAGATLGIVTAGHREVVEPRFAQALGATFLGLAAIAFLLGAAPIAWLLVAAVAALQTLLAATGICVGCRLYFLRWWVPSILARLFGRADRWVGVTVAPISYAKR